MADSSDVEQALVNLIGAALYPNGTSQPSIVGTLCTVQRGWPTEADVREAQAAKSVLIRVHAVRGMSREVTRYPREWINKPATTPTLTASVAGNVITFGGTAAAGQYAGVYAGGTPYTYVVLTPDTPSTVAAAFAALIPGSSVSGSALTVPAGAPLPQAVIAMSGTSQMSVTRQEQVFRTVVWAPTPALRDAVYQAMMPAVALTYRLTMPDTSVATQSALRTTGPDDVPSKAGEWRRDLDATYCYAAVVSQTQPPMLFGDLVLNGGTVVSTEQSLAPAQFG